MAWTYGTVPRATREKDPEIPIDNRGSPGALEVMAFALKNRPTFFLPLVGWAVARHSSEAKLIEMHSSGNRHGEHINSTIPYMFFLWNIGREYALASVWAGAVVWDVPFAVQQEKLLLHLRGESDRLFHRPTMPMPVQCQVTQVTLVWILTWRKL